MICQSFRLATRAVRSRQPVAAPPAAVNDGDGVEPRGACGWYDSSWALGQGLRVVEHTGFEHLPPEVPLEWLLQ